MSITNHTFFNKRNLPGVAMASPKSNPYQEMIQQVTGVSRHDAPILERLMRESILHSTLDWLSQEEFANAAREAQQLFKIAPPYFYTQQACFSATFKRMQAEGRLQRALDKKNDQAITKARETVTLCRRHEDELASFCQCLGNTYFPPVSA